jgi:hypothetical protein
MSPSESEVFDSSPTVAQPYPTDTHRANVPEADVQYTAPQSPEGRVDDPGGFHRQSVLPWQAYYDDFAETYDFPDHFPPNQFPPWQHTSYTYPVGSHPLTERG